MIMKKLQQHKNNKLVVLFILLVISLLLLHYDACCHAATAFVHINDNNNNKNKKANTLLLLDNNNIIPTTTTSSSSNRQLLLYYKIKKSNLYNNISNHRFRRHHNNQKLLLYRGGGGGGGSSSSVGLSTIITPTIAGSAATAFLTFNAITLFLIPNVVLRDMYNITPDTGYIGEFNKVIMRTIAVTGFGTAITIYFSTVLLIKQSLVLSHIIGFALLPRILYFWYLLLTKQLSKLGIKRGFFTFNTIVTTIPTITLLLSKNNILPARIFSCMATIKALQLVRKPAQTCKKYLGVSVDNDEMSKSRALIRGLGNELLTSAILIGCLAFGVEPLLSCFITAIIWIILLFDMGYVDQTWKLMDSDGPTAQNVNIIASIILAITFYFARK